MQVVSYHFHGHPILDSKVARPFYGIDILKREVEGIKGILWAHHIRDYHEIIIGVSIKELEKLLFFPFNMIAFQFLAVNPELSIVITIRESQGGIAAIVRSHKPAAIIFLCELMDALVTSNSKINFHFCDL